MNDPSSDDPDFAALPPGLAELVHAELAEKEKLVWVGRPRVGRMMLSALPSFVYGILIGGFLLFWVGTALGSRLPTPLALLALPTAGVSLLMVTLPIWVARKASGTCYALTDRRAIVWEPDIWRGIKVRSYLPEDLRRIWRNERADGSGDLVFDEVATYGHRGSRRVTRLGFIAIDDVRGVEARIRSTFRDRFEAPGRMRFDLGSS